MVQSVLILGGAKSGKSRRAQARAESWPGRHVYLATATAGDDEMARRIARHQAVRGELWSTVEEPLELAAALKRADGEDAVLLVDCLTLWLTNLLLMAGLDDAAVAGRCAELAGLVPRLAGRVILVANEVGMGIVPGDGLSRRFRDLAGWLNQQMAAACDEVILVAAGLPLALKSPAKDV